MATLFWKNIKKLIDGVPAYGGRPKFPGLITKVPCEKMKGLSRNDGMVITIRGGAKFGSQPDTKPDDVKNSSSKTKADGVTTKEVDRVAKAMADSATLPSELDTPEFREAWGDFIVHRKQKDSKGKGMTERSAKTILNKLVKAQVTPDEAVDLINTAIECNWSSVFPKEPAIKAVKRSGNSSRTRSTKAGPEALLASDMAAIGSVA